MDSHVNINIFDALVLSILGLSALVAFFRGFIRELLSLGAWVGAAIITIYLFPHATDFLKHRVKSDHVAAGAAALGTYIASLIVISMFFSIILRYAKSGPEVGLFDNFLGLIFGALRGAFILSLSFVVLAAFIPHDNPPDWFKTSMTAPYLEKGAGLLQSAAPKYLNEFESIIQKKKEDIDSSGTTPSPDSVKLPETDTHRGK